MNTQRPVRVDLLANVKAQLSSRTRYGTHTYRVSRAGYVVLWSNDCQCWTRYYYKTPANSVVTLDANEVYVPGVKADVDALLPHIPPHPLYRHSTEAKARGGWNPSLSGYSVLVKKLWALDPKSFALIVRRKP